MEPQSTSDTKSGLGVNPLSPAKAHWMLLAPLGWLAANSFSVLLEGMDAAKDTDMFQSRHRDMQASMQVLRMRTSRPGTCTFPPPKALLPPGLKPFRKPWSVRLSERVMN